MYIFFKAEFTPSFKVGLVDTIYWQKGLSLLLLLEVCFKFLHIEKSEKTFSVNINYFCQQMYYVL